MEKLHMTWDMFNDDIEEFIKFLNRYNFTKDSVILGLKRGGLTTSVTLSNLLNIPISLVSYQTRDGENEIKFLEPELIKNAKKIIIPDDIYDSGKTIENIINELENNFNKSLNDITGLFHFISDNIHKTRLKYYRSIRPNEGRWVVMPWEYLQN